MAPAIAPATAPSVPAEQSENVSGKREAHVLMVTSPGDSHCNIFLQLLHQLGQKYPKLTVTVVGSEKQLARLENLPCNLDLRPKAVFKDAARVINGTENANVLTGSVGEVELNRLQAEPLRKELVANKDAPGSPTCIISAKFHYWSADWASELDVPWYPVYPTPFFALVMVEMPKIGKSVLRPDRLSNIIPGVVPAPFLSFVYSRDLSPRFYEDREIVAKTAARVKRAAALVVNSSEGLDRQGGTVDGLRSALHSSRVFAVGPILQYPGFGVSLADSVVDAYGMDWLDSQREKSVLYVAFGTLLHTPTAVILEIAKGIEASGVPFLWVLELGSRTLTEVLPPGFADRTKGRGRIETCFVPQPKILSHPSTGGFLTHGGWNSLLEGLCADVPIIAWPMGADQPVNVRFVVDLAKAGYSLSDFKAESKHTFEDIGSREVEKAVRHVMLEEKDGDVRRNMKAMQEIMHVDVAEGGSSYRNLHAFLDEIANPRSCPEISFP